MNQPTPELALVTGVPRLLARRVARAILARRPSALVALFTPESLAAQTQTAQQNLPQELQSRTRLQLGDVSAIDLGLAGPELQPLAASVTHLFHLAENNDPNTPPATLRRENLEGTANVLSFAAECPNLQRVVYLSSAFVSGDRAGVVMEDELDEGQSFHNAYEESKFEAEALVQSWSNRIPITVVRPSLLVGDSLSGEADGLAGPFYAVAARIISPKALRLPLPGSGHAPLNLVPVDFVAEALAALAYAETAKGQTFHLTDPNPLSTKRVFDLVAQLSGKKPPLGRIPLPLTRLLMKTPGMERLLRAPRQAVEQLNHFALYHCRNTRETLRPLGIECPEFESYAPVLVQYAAQQLAETSGT
jgi:thioester reductase-like protein